MNTRPENDMIGDVTIRTGLDGLTPARIITLYRRAPLLRAVDAPDRVWRMFESSSLVIAAWAGTQLVGIARVLTDGVANSYLCELAVEPDVQGIGIGRRLVEELVAQCRGTDLIVRDSTIASTYYEQMGFVRAEAAWVKRL